MIKVLLTGSTGQLGRNFKAIAPLEICEKKIEIFAPTRKELNLENLKDCREIVINYKPDYILNSGAYTFVDRAEKETQLVQRVNYEAPKVFSEEIKRIGGRLIQLSTDFVFDGNQNFPYKPNAVRNPINTYGRSKADAEEIIERLLLNSNQGLILRTSWVMGPYGNNFISTILKLHQTKTFLQVVNDQIGCPTSTSTLAQVCWKLIENWEKNESLPFIIHYSDAGVGSWYDVAVAISQISQDLGLIRELKEIRPIPSIDFKTAARRPSYSLLDSFETREILDMPTIYWRDVLKNDLKFITKRLIKIA